MTFASGTPTMGANNDASTQVRNTANASTLSASNNATPNIDDHRIQALSRELQDLILDFTLLAGVECRDVQIGAAYKPPWQLGVNQRTRKFLVKHYHRTSIFTAVEKSPSQWRGWLCSLPPNTMPLIQEIRVSCHPLSLGNVKGAGPFHDPSIVRWDAGNYTFWLDHITAALRTSGIRLRENVLKLPVLQVEGAKGDVRWMSKAEICTFMQL